MSGGAVQWPPDGSGFRLQPMNPSSFTARSSSPMHVGERHAGRLRQLAHADEVARIERADAVNQIVAVLGPVKAGRRVADVVRHRRRARREDRDVGAALALELQLRALQALANLVVA